MTVPDLIFFLVLAVSTRVLVFQVLDAVDEFRRMGRRDSDLLDLGYRLVPDRRGWVSPDKRTFIPYLLVCYMPEEKSVLELVREQERLHAPLPFTHPAAEAWCQRQEDRK